ncbi:chemotaxis protein CheX [Granulicella sibirica]|uniref:Chemotaxis phosphatase CheX-like domain-containing protein n=1 Tax=Granulicella sibirica TaxID=2479048 RepID=A0A4Q0SYG7_9BACT|nr:chemotaxis protein CheX [Granulicella sibirica]RXH56283.1 hypothetical protein GRAN_3140 [Granulicella sibirica]
MPAAHFSTWMDHSVAEVLESMCFLTAEESTLPMEQHGEALVSRRLEFRGPELGCFGVQTTLPTARMIACNLLGEELEEITEEQAGEAVGEIANMVCGAFLARFEAKQAFDLTHPHMDHPLEQSEASATRISRSFLIEEGGLIAWMEIEEGK